MVTHMKTTIEIADALLKEAQKVAARENTTLRALVEEGLRQALEGRRRKRRPFKLKLVTVRGRGLAPGVPEDLPRTLAYEFPSTDE